MNPGSLALDCMLLRLYTPILLVKSHRTLEKDRTLVQPGPRHCVYRWGEETDRLAQGQMQAFVFPDSSSALFLFKKEVERQSGFPAATVVESSAYTEDARDVGSVSGRGRSPGWGNGSLLQYSYLKNSMDREAWWTTSQPGRKESDMAEWAHSTRHSCWLVAQSCPTLCHPMDCSSPGSSIHGVSQARRLEWVAISFSRGSFWPRDWTHISCLAGRLFTTKPPGKPSKIMPTLKYKWEKHAWWTGIWKNKEYVKKYLAFCGLPHPMHAKSLQSCPTLWDLWTVAYQVPLSMGFSRQEYWSRLLCPPPGHLPHPGIEPACLMSPALTGGFFTTSATHLRVNFLFPGLDNVSFNSSNEMGLSL